MLITRWSPGHGQPRSAEVPLDVQGQVVWTGERSAADIAFERLDSGVFPLRGCSDNKWEKSKIYFYKILALAYKEELHRCLAISQLNNFSFFSCTTMTYILVTNSWIVCPMSSSDEKVFTYICTNMHVRGCDLMMHNWAHCQGSLCYLNIPCVWWARLTGQTSSRSLTSCTRKVSPRCGSWCGPGG